MVIKRGSPEDEARIERWWADRGEKRPEKKQKQQRIKLVKTPPLAIASDAKVINAIAPETIAKPPSPAIAGIIAGDKWTGIPNDILDNVLGTLEPYDQVVLIRLYRLTWGFKRDWCEVSLGKLAKGCNISPRQAGISTSRLIAGGLILRLKTGKTETAKYRMLLPPAIAKNAVAEGAKAGSADIKYKALKDKELKSEHMTPDEVRELMNELDKEK